ncbi:nuclear nucleic acid-binding protein C1D isoform X2 [Bubalus kerabau]|uniref:nuclear nucleic acid-binding protein C1D isoform X2 n=1 Tax=Bubalus carabanensis TaxID=3119969 RepID=UPI00244EAD8C|nr:nuclear nucleic acid-binding protein C1D isoform X2 [Bubalus carabanensis]
MAGEGINEDYPVEIHEYLSTFENSIGAVDEMLKTMMSVSRNELLQKLDPLEQAKVDLVSAYTLNSMFWVYLATQGVNPKEHPVKQELNLHFPALDFLEDVFVSLDLSSLHLLIRATGWQQKNTEELFCFCGHKSEQKGDTRDASSVPGLGRAPGVGNGNPFQYSYLENSMDRGAWQATVHGTAKSDMT